MAFRRRLFSPRLKSGYRSKSEEKFAAHLETLGVPFSYEERVIKYRQKDAGYKVDFELPEHGFILEYKGYFSSEDRAKHLLIKEQHPDLDIRFVFDRASNPLSKKSKTTYADWCTKHGFQYAEKIIPPSWITGTKETKND